jgi:hypothetical protein
MWVSHTKQASDTHASTYIQISQWCEPMTTERRTSSPRQVFIAVAYCSAQECWNTVTFLVPQLYAARAPRLPVLAPDVESYIVDGRVIANPVVCDRCCRRLILESRTPAPAHQGALPTPLTWMAASPRSLERTSTRSSAPVAHLVAGVLAQC